MRTFFKKMGVEHLAGLLAVALTAATVRPVLDRYFKKLAQLTLPATGNLHQMGFRRVLKPEEVDTYVSEHGFNKQFRDGLLELAYALPQPANMADAMFRAVAFEGFDSAKAVAEITDYFSLSGFKPDARKGFSFSDQQIAAKLIYTIPNFRQLRVLAMVGSAVQKDLEKVLVSERMRPEYISKIAGAAILQGLLPYIKTQAMAFEVQVTHGFETISTFTDLLKKINFPAPFIQPTLDAAALKANETVDVLTVSEYDKQYTEGYMERDPYVAKIATVIKNAAILKVHLAIADLARTRLEDSRIRTAGDRAIAQELTAFAQGAVSPQDFEAIAKAMGKTKAEIDALEQARQIITKNLVRVARFRTYQTQLAKLVITPSQFTDSCLKLPIDADLVSAAEQRILTALLPKPKQVLVDVALAQIKAAQAKTVAN